MKRLAVLSGLVIAGVICLATAGQQQPAALEIQKVKNNLYMITGGGGNTAAFIAERGVVVVDTKLAGNGPAILDNFVRAKLCAYRYRHFFTSAVQFKITLTGVASPITVPIKNRCPSDVTS